MKIFITKSYDELSNKAASIVADQINKKPNSVLGLPTGATPLGMYKNLVNMYKEGLIDFSQITTFNLDEYLNLAPHHPQSYNYYMQKNFFEHINIRAQNVHIPRGDGINPLLCCETYDQAISQYEDIDLMILGIGVNGHIGFNEPGPKLHLLTHIANLDQETIKSNSSFFPTKEEIPRKAITIGIQTILQAKKTLLLANGESKAKIIKATLNGEVSTYIPSSFLQLHKDLTVIIDDQAARLL